MRFYFRSVAQIISGFVMLWLTLALSASVSAATTMEVEPNDSIEAATPLVFTVDGVVDGLSIALGRGEKGGTQENASDFFSFEAEAGDVVTIRLWVESGNLQPTLQLKRPDGSSFWNASSSGGVARIVSLTIPASGIWGFNVTGATVFTGTYGVHVLRYQGVHEAEYPTNGVGSNDVLNGAEGVRPLRTETAGSLANVPHVGTLEPGDVDNWKVYVAAGEAVTVTVSGTVESTVNPVITLLDEAGEVLATGAADGQVASVTLASLPMTGIVFIEVLDDQGGGFQSFYTLDVHIVGRADSQESEPNDTPETAVLMVAQAHQGPAELTVLTAYGERGLTGDLSNDYYRVNLGDGEAFTMTVWRTSGNYAPTFSVHRPDGSTSVGASAIGPDGEVARIANLSLAEISLSEPGEWTICVKGPPLSIGSYGVQVLRYPEGLEGESFGNNDVFGAFEPMVLSEPLGDGALKTPDYVGLLDEDDTDTWAFFAFAGEPVSVHVNASIDTQVTLFDATGAVLAGAVGQSGETSVFVDALPTSTRVHAQVSPVGQGSPDAKYTIWAESLRQPGFEIEENDALETAQAIPPLSGAAGDVFRMTEVVGAFGWVGDFNYDYFALHLDAGQRVMVTVYAHDAGDLDPSVALYDPNNLSVASDFNSGPGNTARRGDFLIDTPGLWRLQVGNAAGGVGTYTLQVVATSGRTESDASGQNNALALRDDIPLGLTNAVVGVIDGGDTDVFGFPLPGSTPFMVTLMTPEQSTGVFSLELLDTTGAPIEGLEVTNDGSTVLNLVTSEEVVAVVTATEGAGYDAHYALTIDPQLDIHPDAILENNGDKVVTTLNGPTRDLGGGCVGYEAYGAVSGFLDAGSDMFLFTLDRQDHAFITLEALAGDFGAFGVSISNPNLGDLIHSGQSNIFGYRGVLSNIAVTEDSDVQVNVSHNASVGFYRLRVCFGPDGGYTFQGRRWSYQPEAANWHQARARAAVQGKTLARVNDDSERQFINLAFGSQASWLGLHDLDHDRQWSWLGDDTVVWDSDEGEGADFITWHGSPPFPASAASPLQVAATVTNQAGVWASRSPTNGQLGAILQDAPVQITSPLWPQSHTVADSPWFRAAYLGEQAPFTRLETEWSLSDGRASQGEEAGHVTLYEPGSLSVNARVYDDSGASLGEDTVSWVVKPSGQVDVAIVEVGCDTTLIVGEPQTLTLQVANLGPSDLDDSRWQDGIYISQDERLDSTDELIAFESQQEPLAVMESVTTVFSVVIPEHLAEEANFLIVATDHTGAISDAHRGNNTLAIPVAVDFMMLSDGDTVTGLVGQPSLDALYAVNVSQGEHLGVSVSSEGPGCIEVQFSSLTVPSDEGGAYTLLVCPDEDGDIQIPNPAPGQWFLRVVSTSVTATFTLTLELYSLGVTQLSPKAHPSDKPLTLVVDGAGFMPGLEVLLHADNGTTYTPLSIALTSPTQVVVSYGADTLPVGAYTLSVTQDAQTVESSETLVVLAPEQGTPEVSLELIVPGRSGRTAMDTFYTLCTNTGDVAIDAPIVLTHADRDAKLTQDMTLLPRGFWGLGLPAGFSDYAFAMAHGEIPGVLQPGETAVLKSYYAGIRPPWSNEQFLTVTSRYLLPGSSRPTDWDAFSDRLRPSRATDEVWAFMLSGMQQALGLTEGTMSARLAKEVAHHALFISDEVLPLPEALRMVTGGGGAPLIRLEDLELLTDLRAPTPGVALTQSRSYATDLISRQWQGLLGRGWRHQWEARLVFVDNEGVELEEANGTVRLFERDMRGGFFSFADDSAELVELVDGGFSVVEPRGGERRFDATGRMVMVADVAGNHVTAEWQDSQLMTLTHSSGDALSFTYVGGRMETVTSNTGEVLTYAYDDRGRMVSVQKGEDPAQGYGWLDGAEPFDGAITEVSLGGVLQYAVTYGPRQRITGISGPAVLDAQYTYPALDTPGSMSSVVSTDPLGRSRTLRFDSEARLRVVEDALGFSVRYHYDEYGRYVGYTDALGYRERYERDRQGRLFRVEDAAGGVTRLVWSSAGHMTHMVDPRGDETNFERDEVGRVTELNLPSGESRTMTYTPEGQLATFTGGHGETTSFVYDAQGLMLERAHQGTVIETRTYDAEGSVIGATNEHGALTFVRDEAGFLESSSSDFGTPEVTLSRDAQRRLVAIQEADALPTHLTYDAMGRIDEVRVGDGEAFEVAYTYDAAGAVLTRTLGNGVVVHREYDNRGLTARIHAIHSSGQTLQDETYAYDALGRPETVQTQRGLWRYTYDVVGRLTAAEFESDDPTLPSTSRLWTYDAAGNRLTERVDGVEVQSTYAAHNQLFEAGSWDVSTDAQGRMTKRVDTETGQSVIYAYDATDRLVSLTTEAGQPHGFTYDALGARRTGTLDGAPVRYGIDHRGLSNVLSIRDMAGQVLAHCVHGRELEGMHSDAGARYFLTDLTGNVVKVLDGAGEVLNDYLYTPFGHLLFASESVPNPFTYHGSHGVMKESDDLFIMRARAYAPSLGRFITPDPLGLLSGDPNLYAFVGSQPTARVDPSGMLASKSSVNGHPVWDFIRNVWGDARRVWRTIDEAGKEVGVDAKDTFEKVVEISRETDTSKQAQGATSLALGLAGNMTRLGGGSVTVVAEYLLNPENAKNIADGLNAIDMQRKYGLNWRAIREGFDFYCMTACGGTIGCDECESGQGPTAQSSIAASSDPNQKVGPAGVGPEGWVTGRHLFPYRIDFENESEATAPAQQVDIYDPLPSALNWETFEVTSVGWGDILIPVPPGSHAFTHIEPYSYQGVDFEVHVDIGVDTSTGLLEAHFYSINPIFGTPPPVDIGFLPPEDETGRGQGFFTFTVEPHDNLSSGTELTNIATIIFDLGESIDTNQVDPHDKSQGTDPEKECRNTIDVDSPTSSATSPSTSPTAAFAVSWSGQDSHSGVATYDVFARVQGGEWERWLHGIEATSALFNGDLGTTYEFYALATDAVGNQEEKDPVVETVTEVTPPHPCTLDGCDDADACTDDLCDPETGCSHTAVSCIDGDICTIDVCEPTLGCQFTPVVCDDGDACTTDSCDAELGCTTEPVVCDDGDACTTDTCDAAVGCTTEPVVCDDGDACTTDGCDVELGCTTEAVMCDDGDACTIDSCDAAVGCTTEPVVCDDGDACTTDGCDAELGCTTEPVVCDDGDACTTDSCDAELGCTTEPVVCDDGDACTTDSCDAAVGCKTEPVVCDDGDACTTDTCDAELGCTTEAVMCDDGDACTTDSCDAAVGCTTEPVVCDDGDACTIDSCDAAVGCTTEPVVCDDGDACTTDSCEADLGCTTEPVVCDDSDACTTDSCDAAVGCTTEPVVCDDGDACTTDGCDAELGCTTEAVVCDDGDACTTDSCEADLGCTTEPVVCNDGDACTDDRCDVTSGCIFGSNGSCDPLPQPEPIPETEPLPEVETSEASSSRSGGCQTGKEGAVSYHLVMLVMACLWVRRHRRRWAFRSCV